MPRHNFKLKFCEVFLRLHCSRVGPGRAQAFTIAAADSRNARKVKRVPPPPTKYDAPPRRSSSDITSPITRDVIILGAVRDRCA